jgi:hypothetical protein
MQYFGEISARPADLPEHVTFLFLCFTNRCGPNHLADLLVATNQFRRAREILNGSAVVKDARAQGHLSLQEYFTWLALRRSTRRGVVVSKLAIPHLGILGDAGLLEHPRPLSWSIVHDLGAAMLNADIAYAIAN